MKLIKLIAAVIMSLGLMIAQPPNQGGTQQGPPPCDQWLNSNMAHDMNGDGVVDEGDCPGAGPPPFEAVDTNGDGSIDREEARAMFGQDKDGNPDPEFDNRFDNRAGDDGMVDHAEYMAPGGGDHDGPATCDVCGYEYGGPDDHHGHCRVCDAEMNADEDWQSHCEENPDHCKAQAGDVCGFRGWDGQGEECGYVHTGDPDEDHHHCDHCGLAVNSGEEMHNHMQADHPDMMGQHDGGGGDHDGQQHFPNNHWDGNCGAMMNGQSEYWLDSDGDPNNGPEDGPYAVWHEDADGNPVNCGPGPEDHGGPPECPECGHQYADENDQHGHCPTCGEALNGEADWEDHCTNNEDHCKDPVADAFFNTYAETQDYEAAFNAGAAVAREMAQNEDDYNEDEWNDGRDCFHAAMTSYLDGGGDSPEGAMEAMYQSGCDEGPGGQGGPQGPPPTCEEVDANGDGSIDRDEARAKFGHDPQGNPDPNFDQRYDEVVANGDGVVDCVEHDAAVAEGGNNN